jgi:hypothetical protein
MTTATTVKLPEVEVEVESRGKTKLQTGERVNRVRRA